MPMLNKGYVYINKFTHSIFFVMNSANYKFKVHFDECRHGDVVIGAPFYHRSGVGGAIYVYMNGPEVWPTGAVFNKLTSSSCHFIWWWMAFISFSLLLTTPGNTFDSFTLTCKWLLRFINVFTYLFTYRISYNLIHISDSEWLVLWWIWCWLYKPKQFF